MNLGDGGWILYDVCPILLFSAADLAFISIWNLSARTLRAPWWYAGCRDNNADKLKDKLSLRYPVCVY